MNVILIMNDTLRYDHIGANGNPWISTPNLDAFAAEAAVFDHNHLCSFPTVPNRHEMMKGRHGNPFQAWRPLEWGAMTLPKALRLAGYETMFIHDTPHLANFGFGFDRPFSGWEFVRGNEADRWRTDYFSELQVPGGGKFTWDQQATHEFRNYRHMHREEDQCVARVMSAACEWLDHNAGHEKFFLWIDSFDPHEPWDPPQHYVDMYDPDFEGEKISWPSFGEVADRFSPAEQRNLKALYAGEVTMMDRWIGRVLTKIDDLGLRDSTAVVIMSDHGFDFFEHGYVGKRAIYPEVVRTVQMVRLPDGAGAGRRIPQLTQHPDFAPSVFDLTGVEVPDGMDIQGRSWAPLLQGGEYEARTATVSGNGPSYFDPRSPFAAALAGRFTGWSPLQVTDGRWWLVDNADPGMRELYDVDTDPDTQVNLYGQEPEHYARLHGELQSFLERSAAPEFAIRLFRDGPEGIDPKQGAAVFAPGMFPDGVPMNTVRPGNVVRND